MKIQLRQTTEKKPYLSDLPDPDMDLTLACKKPM